MEIHSNSSDIPYGFWFVGSLDQDQRRSMQSDGRALANMNFLKDIRKMVTQIQAFHNIFYKLSEEIRRNLWISRSQITFSICAC